MARWLTVCIGKTKDQIQTRSEHQDPTEGAPAPFLVTLGQGAQSRKPHVTGAYMMKQKGLSTIRRPAIHDHCLKLGSL